MNQWWAIVMLISGGLFAGGVVSIAWERVPAWRGMAVPEFQTSFAHTLRRVDRIQPVLLTICLVSTTGFAASAKGPVRLPALLTAGCLLIVLLGSAVWLVPLQRRLVTLRVDQSSPSLQRLRDQWFRGHLIRTVVSVVALSLAVVAAAL